MNAVTVFVLLVNIIKGTSFIVKPSVHSTQYSAGIQTISRQETTTRINMLTDPFTSNILATIDADIEKISNEDFGLVFLGGILVMVGGVISALIVGFILDRSNNYAELVADSYAEGGDEAFLNSLSPEDRQKAKEMIEKLRKSKSGDESIQSRTTEQTQPSPDVLKNKEPKREVVSMFNDYED